MIFFAIFFIEIIFLFFLSRMLTTLLSYHIFKVTKHEHFTIYLISFLFLPGTIIHELSHMLTAAVLFVPIGAIEFVPTVTDHGIKLGSVSIAKTDPIRRALIGFAPFFIGILCLLGSVYYLLHISTLPVWGNIVLASFIAFELGNTMFSSTKDMEGAAETFGALLIIGILLYAVGLKIPAQSFSFFFSKEAGEVYKMLSLSLLVPGIIDILCVAMLKLIKK